jgi:tetratricopeptide (TPR) repeat protein
MEYDKVNRHLALFESWVAENPSSQLFVELACLYQELNRLPEAIAVMERAIGFHPQHLKARLLLSRMYRQAGRTRQARDILVQALFIIEAQQQIFHELGELAPEHGPELNELAGNLNDLVKLLRGKGWPETAAGSAPGPPRVRAVLDKLESLKKAAGQRYNF